MRQAEPREERRAALAPPVLPAQAPQGLGRWIGPGVLTGASDDDPSGIGTYAQVGAQFGLGQLWTMLFSYPLMVAVQLICARIGRVTGKGLAGNLRQELPAALLLVLIVLLLLANTINIGADLGAMGAAMQLLLGGHAGWYTAFFGMASVLLEVFLPYHRYVLWLKWFTLALLAYGGIVFVVHIPWGEVARNTFWPHIVWRSDYLTSVVAVFGTTISPYLFFWQASQEVEEMQAAPGARPLKRAAWQAPNQLHRIAVDTYVGMGVSNLVAYFIILSTALTLHVQGVHNIASAADAAAALKPMAGPLAFALFAAGIIGTGLLAVPVLAGSAAYGVGEALRWQTGLERPPSRALGFYGVIIGATLGGTAMNELHINPMQALYWTAVLNGLVAVPMLVAIMVVASRRRVMGSFVLSPGLEAMGWLTTVVMAVCALAMFLG